jgi:hypothetical protein
MQVIKQYLEATQTEAERAALHASFIMGWSEFQRVMDIYMK